MTDDRDEREALRALASLLDLPPEPAARPLRPAPALPFEVPPALDPPVRRALEAAALEANERYLRAFVEAHSFCPYSRSGRAKGLTARFVHGLDGQGVEALLARMEEVAEDATKVVVQVILPLAEVGPAEWSRFCHALTEAGNDRLRASAPRGADVFAVAPLHPELAYTATNPYALIPLLRRAPDPTIQWVRLDALAELYRGREGDTVYVDPSQITARWAPRERTPLFERIAETNLQMALRLGIDRVEAELAQIARSGRERYARVLLGETAPAAEVCPHHAVSAAQRRVEAPRPARREGARWVLARLRELPGATPVAFVAGGVELVVVRAHDATHVLYGRCPHRFARLSEAIVEDDRLVCPHHGWDFRLDDGRSEGVRGASIARFTALDRAGWLELDAAELEAFSRAHPPAFGDDDEVL